MELKSKRVHPTLPTLFVARNFNVLKEPTSISNIFKYYLKDFFYKEYLVSPVEDLRVVLNLAGEQGLYFLFCWEGNMTIAIDEEDTLLGEFQSAIIHDRYQQGVSINLKGNTHYRFCLIGFNQPLEVENSSYIKFKNVFLDRVNSDYSVFIGNPYLKLIRYIDKLSQKIKQKTVSRLIIEGLIY